MEHGRLRDADPPTGDKRTTKGKRKAKSHGISRLRNGEIRRRQAAALPATVE